MQLGLFLVFVAVPLLELAVLIKVGQLIGFWWTLFLVLSSAVVGMWVLQSQGFAVMRRTMEQLQAGKPPIAPAVDGMFLMLAGCLFLVPGLITDVAGALLLIPKVRRSFAAWCVRRFLRSRHVRATVFTSKGSGPQSDRGRNSRPSAAEAPGEGPIIEGEFERLDEKTVDPNRDTRRPRP